MGLRNLTFPTVEVQTSGGPLAVRGLSLDHVLGLFYRHREPLTGLYDSMFTRARAGEEFQIEDTELVALGLINSAPQVAGEIIAVASGSDPRSDTFETDVWIARGLTIAEQMDALQKIGEQTFTSDMPPGKVLALVFQAMRAGTSAMGNLPQPRP